MKIFVELSSSQVLEVDSIRKYILQFCFGKIIWTPRKMLKYNTGSNYYAVSNLYKRM